MSELSESDEYRTPDDLYGALVGLYGPFDLDVCASDTNHKVPRYFTRQNSALARSSWRVKGRSDARAFMNPPYSRGNLIQFMPEARAQVVAHHLALVACVVPHYSDTRWWQDAVEAPMGRLVRVTADRTIIGPRTRTEWESLTVDVIRHPGRVHFTEESGATGPARHSTAMVTFAMPGVLPPLFERRTPGPKRVVTPEIEAAIRAAVDAGATISRAVEAGGISRKTWYRHLERNLRRSA